MATNAKFIDESGINFPLQVILVEGTANFYYSVDELAGFTKTYMYYDVRESFGAPCGVRVLFFCGSFQSSLTLVFSLCCIVSNTNSNCVPCNLMVLSIWRQ